jgi:hypothetical protein
MLWAGARSPYTDFAVSAREAVFFFDLPAIVADQERSDRVCTIACAHGRLETCTLECRTGDYEWLGWPGAMHIAHRTYERHVLRTGKTRKTVTYGITNLPPAETSAAVLEALWREHWYREQLTLCTRCHAGPGSQPYAYESHTREVRAALRNGLLALWRRAGWTNMADAVRATGTSVAAALTFIGVAGFWRHPRQEVSRRRRVDHDIV